MSYSQKEVREWAVQIHGVRLSQTEEQPVQRPYSRSKPGMLGSLKRSVWLEQSARTQESSWRGV